MVLSALGLLAVLAAGCGFELRAASVDAAAEGLDGPDGAPPDPDALPDPDGSPDSPPDAFVAFVARINIAGPAFVGIDHPGSWSADPGVGGICDGARFDAPMPAIPNSNDDVLYRDLMYRNPLACTIPNVPPGTYRVTLLFAELYWGGPPCAGSATGTRIFHVALEGATVLTGFNERVESGGCAVGSGAGRPVDKVFTVTVTDGALNVAMPVMSDNAALNAIELVQQ